MSWGRIATTSAVPILVGNTKRNWPDSTFYRASCASEVFKERTFVWIGSFILRLRNNSLKLLQRSVPVINEPFLAAITVPENHSYHVTNYHSLVLLQSHDQMYDLGSITLWFHISFSSIATTSAFNYRLAETVIYDQYLFIKLIKFL